MEELVRARADEIIEEFPELGADDIRACLHFAADLERPIGELRCPCGQT